jgi:transcriptional antiterminator NusG
MSDESATSTPTADPTAAAGAHPHDHETGGGPPHEPTAPSGPHPDAETDAEHPGADAPHAVPEPSHADAGVETAAVAAPISDHEPATEPKADEPTAPKTAKKSRATKASKPAPPAAEAHEPAGEAEAGTVAVADETDAVPGASEGAEVPPAEPVVENKKKWYAIKVQSGREDSIKAAILRKVRIEGLEEYFGRIEIPFEEVSEKKAVKVKDKKTGETSYQEKKVTRKRKKFQGYLFAELEFNDRILYLFRETSGVGDFLNLRQKPGLPPTPEPMPDHEVQSMLTGVAVRDPSKAKKVKLDFEKGDKVRIRDGSFANSEGEVKAIIEAKDPNEAAKVMVVLTFWGRPLDVELDSSQVEKV